ncbi:MAG TPA: extracellular matrix/biofilm biosynthesis regulator RemA family protein [Bacillaceae bacterium]
MYVHVGDNVMIRSSEIVAILDKDTVNQSETILELLDKRSKDVSRLTEGSFKTLVITGSHMYLSPISAGTLKKHSM